MTIFSRTFDNGNYKSILQCEESLFDCGEYREMTTDISNDGGRTISARSLIMLLKQMNDRIHELEKRNPITIQRSYGDKMVIENKLPYDTIIVGGVKYQRIVEEKSKTLFAKLSRQLTQSHISDDDMYDICDIVRSWLIDHTVIETEDAEKVTFTILKEQLQTPKYD